MTGDHPGRTARRATLPATATNEILGTHRSCIILKQACMARRTVLSLNLSTAGGGNEPGY